MSVYREQVASALRAVRVTSPTSFAWFGRPAPALTRAVRAALDPAAARRYLVARLQRELYESFYLRGLPRPQIPYDALPDGADAAFVAELSRANAGVGGWAPGWSVAATGDDGAIVAERDGLRVRAGASQHRLDDGGALELGAAVSVRRPKEFRAASPGFYLARGDAQRAVDPAAIEVRAYFNLTRAGALPLLAVATGVLNDERIAFSIKLVNHPARYSRCDAAVLYLEAGAFADVRAPLRTLVEACAPHLRAETPALTKRLARGVGIGEHQAQLGPSFGLGRCRLLAEGIADAYERRVTALADRVDAVAARFARCGMDVDRPYLLAGRRDDYGL